VKSVRTEKRGIANHNLLTGGGLLLITDISPDMSASRHLTENAPKRRSDSNAGENSSSGKVVAGAVGGLRETGSNQIFWLRFRLTSL
jgi:hypothetical protein